MGRGPAKTILDKGPIRIGDNFLYFETRSWSGTFGYEYGIDRANGSIVQLYFGVNSKKLLGMSLGTCSKSDAKTDEKKF